ncbi:MAG: RNA polymerase sporulation sigma factor SigG [Clostridia bacterium]|nr:RNA polymerase sporulation sigma factor SigG [Clostridia bacterium]
MKRKVTICGVDTGTLPKLTHEQATDLMLQIKNGDDNARRKFVLCNMRLVLSVVQRYAGKSDNMDDLFQVGCVGLLKAVDNFDVSYNLRFSTYAVPMIVGEIRRFLREGNSLHVSRSVRDMAFLALQAREKLECDSDKQASIADIAKELGQPVEVIKNALDAISEPVSLFEPVYSDESDSVLVMDQIDDKKNTDEKWLENISLCQAIKKLGQREKQILHKRYFEGKTQMEISAEVGISQAQVSRLEKNAMTQMREMMTSV